MTAGIKLKNGAQSLYTCAGSQNDTVADCPVAQKNNSDFVVAISNALTNPSSQLVRIQLPSQNYKVHVFS